MRKGFAIAIAWPETICKQAGAWYDTPMRWIGINKNNYYKVGHAAVVLINGDTGNCYYFDFGRYHTPYQYGRVRDEESDHDLEIKTKAIFDENGKLLNYLTILMELYSNPSCHGSGPLHASYCNIEFESAIRKAKQMQKESPLSYGPFKMTGTNCSRFVNTVILCGKPTFLYWLLLSYPKTLTPTPIGNIKALSNYQRIGWRDTPLSDLIPDFSFLKQDNQ